MNQPSLAVREHEVPRCYSGLVILHEILCFEDTIKPEGISQDGNEHLSRVDEVRERREATVLEGELLVVIVLDRDA